MVHRVVVRDRVMVVLAVAVIMPLRAQVLLVLRDRDTTVMAPGRLAVAVEQVKRAAPTVLVREATVSPVFAGMLPPQCTRAVVGQAITTLQECGSVAMVADGANVTVGVWIVMAARLAVV